MRTASTSDPDSQASPYPKTILTQVTSCWSRPGQHSKGASWTEGAYMESRVNGTAIPFSDARNHPHTPKRPNLRESKVFNWKGSSRWQVKDLK